MQRIDQIAGFLACFVPLAFAGYLYFENVPLPATTFLLLTFLNAVNLVTKVKAGVRDLALPVGYTAGAGMTALMLIWNGNLSFGMLDATAGIAAILALILSRKSGGAGRANVLAVASMWIASVPLIVDTFTSPDVRAWWMWAGCLVANVLSSYVAVKTAPPGEWWRPERSLYQLGGTVFSALLLTLTLR